MRTSLRVLLEVAEWQEGRLFFRTATLVSPYKHDLKVHLWSLEANVSISSDIVVVIEQGRRFVSWKVRRDRFSRLLRLYNRKLDSYIPRHVEEAA